MAGSRLAALETAIYKAAKPHKPGDPVLDAPLIWADQTLYHPDKLPERITAKSVFVASMNQAQLEHFCSVVECEPLGFKGLRADNLAPLARISALRRLKIWWAPKFTSLAPLAGLPFTDLVVSDTKRLTSLADVAQIPTLKSFEFSGGMSTKCRCDTLAPLALLPDLVELNLLAIDVDEGGLRPLAGCHALRHLSVSSQFETADYAYLSVKLPMVACEGFAPFQMLTQPLGSKNVMVTGRRKPFLNRHKDAARLAKYVADWDKLVAEFRAET